MPKGVEWGSPSPRLGAAAMRQRVAAILGTPRCRAAAVPLRQRRNTKPVVPAASQASCSRRPAVGASTPTSPMTAASTALRNPSSIAQRMSSSLRQRASSSRSGASP